LSWLGRGCGGELLYSRVDGAGEMFWGKNRFGVFTDISSQRTVVWPDVHALVSVLRALVSVLRVFGFFFIFG